MHLAFILLCGAVILLAIAKGPTSWHGIIALVLSVLGLLVYLFRLRILG